MGASTLVDDEYMRILFHLGVLFIRRFDLELALETLYKFGIRK